MRAHEWLWRPQPFKEQQPAWGLQLPALSTALLSLTDNDLAHYSHDDAPLLALLGQHVPELRALLEWRALSDLEQHPLADSGPHFIWQIPGRKWAQITAFAATVGMVKQPLLEWCGGKGHLGRLLAQQWQVPVMTLEKNKELCAEGECLAQRAHIAQQFVVADVLAESQSHVLNKKHVVALHACGELHRTLVRQAVAAQVPALDLAPCCYYFAATNHYQPFTEGLQLQLRRDDLRLAVTETATSSVREVQWRDQEMAWKLGFDRWRRDVTGDDHYHPIAPIDKSWLRLEFNEFCRLLAQREQVYTDADAAHYEAIGWQRQHDVMRLSLVRQSFRRVLELWLVLDMASFMESHGYRVRIGQFCQRTTTPRNILLSARLAA
ncbi:MAG: methyltransferase [Gammaproteobacteria bacterium]|nr:methyltransferase [Gammaproteobacteria bacterium]